MVEESEQQTQQETCSECGGSGAGEALITPDDYEGDAPVFDDLEAIATVCARCGGTGNEYVDGCPRCGAEMHDHGVMPSSCIKFGCHECGFWELVG